MASRFTSRDAVIGFYRNADPTVRWALDRTAELLNAMTKRACDLVLRHNGTPEAEAVARRAVERVRPLIARAAAIINGAALDVSDRRGPQTAIDAMFAA